LVIIVRQS